MTIHRKTPRLASEKYVGRQTCFITICCDRRAPHFDRSTNAAAAPRLLLECAAKKSFLLHAYCFMPDHLHVLAEGTEPDSDLLEFVRLFKQFSAFAFRRSSGRQLWETGFYDYVLRASDSIENVAAYIWWNPVRGKICKEPKDYPFSGSQTIDWIVHSRAETVRVAPWKKEEPR